MATLTHMDGVPLFSTAAEALLWSSRLGYGLTEYHTHVYNGKTGYMIGKNHAEIYEIHTKQIIQSTPQPTTSGGGY